MLFSRPTSTTAPARPRRVQAIYDCEADNQDELTFVENEVIVVTGVEDQEWWVSTQTMLSFSLWLFYFNYQKVLEILIFS